MARFYGSVGFSVTKETRPGIFEETYIEKKYKGDVVRNTRRWDQTEYLNDDITINNDISIIADGFAISHFGVMRYVRWMHQTFEITSATIDVDTHRITLSIGGVFNVPDEFSGEEDDTSSIFDEDS